MYCTIVGFIFGATLGLFGFPLTTYQYWILVALFAIYGELRRDEV